VTDTGDELSLTTAASIELTVDHLEAGLARYLTELGLPTDAVLVAPAERLRVLRNLPDVANEIPAEQRARAYYISKFIAACGAGLFDAALNFLWDETVSNLREKVARFDLEYFLDSIITDPRRRAAFRSGDDLDKLEDWELVRGCLETGIITDIGFKHLDYIRNIRNFASAAHPNQNELTGLQVVSWLETCIREVLSKEPAGGAIEVRKLLRSLRSETLGPEDVEPIAESLGRLPDDLVRALARAVFGMFTDPSVAAEVRNNIALVAPPLWAVCPDDIRFEVGVKHETFAVNGEVARRSLARLFLETVEGLSYLPPNALGGEIASAVGDLLRVHNGFNNFHNEPAYARVLENLVPATGRIPPSAERDYVKVLLLCRIGNGYGVSDAAGPAYDRLIGRWSERQVVVLLQLLADDKEVGSRLQFSLSARNLKALAAELSPRAPNRLVNRALSMVAEAGVADVAKLPTRASFRSAVAALPRR